MCNHAIGFCQLIDNLVYIEKPDRLLSEECPDSLADIIFDYCPFCGEGLKYLMLKK